MYSMRAIQPAIAIAAAILFSTPTSVAGAQDPMHEMNMAGMTMGGTLGISMERMGSGTTWIPDAVTLPSRHFNASGWDVMLHGFVFGQYDRQGGPRGDEQFGSLNWGMVMASHPLSGGTLQLRSMLSLDPATVSGRGYPMLLQTGESYRGEPLHDRQHPHDFFMEVAALYERAVATNAALSLYVAPSGEPALGPVAFMHRPSGMDDPFAPLGHHWQDATHISFGVVTAGLFTQRWKLEGSVFNGREPDDRRWNFDRIRLDSYSGRMTFNPSEHWSLTAGYGYMKSPEILEPGEPMRRLVTSILHGVRLGTDGQWASALVYGTNKHEGHERSSSLLAESELVLDRWNTFLARAEVVQKSGGELVLDGPPASLDPDELFNIGALSLGYIRELGRFRGVTIGLGGRGSVNFIPRQLESAYGSRTPSGGMLFIRIRPHHETMGMTMPGMHDGH
jgi:hypothetical protein